MNFATILRNFSTKNTNHNLLYEILFVPLHRVIDKFKEYDSRIQY